MTFDNTFSTPISVLKFMYDTEKKVSNLLTSPLSNIISTFRLETDELVVANETIPVPKISVNVEPNANYLDKIVLVFKNYVSTTGKTYIVYSKITEIQDELFVVSVISTEYFNELSLNPRGEWMSGNEYHINDIVNSNNALYICIKSIVSSTTRPENDTQHFSLWLSPPISSGRIQSITYNNISIGSHLSEILSYVNMENGGTLLNITCKTKDTTSGIGIGGLTETVGSSSSHVVDTFHSLDGLFVFNYMGISKANETAGIPYSACFIASLNHTQVNLFLSQTDVKINCVRTECGSNIARFTSVDKDITDYVFDYITINYI